MRKLIKEALLLCLITLTAGVLLASVHEITLKPIQKQEAMTQQNACKEVFKDADSFKEIETNVQKAVEQDGFTAEEIETVFTASDDQGTPLGYVFKINEAKGYGGTISFMMGVRLDGTLNGISILSISETAGLGMNADSDSFKKQFENKKAETIRFTKNKATAEDEIDAISGATITTTAMTDGVNAGLCAYRHLIEEEVK